MQYHSIHTISVADCQEMLMTDDYMLICRSKTRNPFIKRKAKQKHAEFIEDLSELFSGEDVSKLIDKDVLLQGMRLKLNNAVMLCDALTMCYGLKDEVLRNDQIVPNTDKIKLMSSLNASYRFRYFDYLKPVDQNVSVEEQNKVIEYNLKPIKSEISRLKYKIKDLTPKQKEVEEEPNNLGLSLHISFVEAVENNGYLDRNISVSELKLKYDQAIIKNNKLKMQQNG
jgi:hypothetical protein